MGKYKVTSPDGQAYEITAPDGATNDEIMAYAQRNFKMSKAPAAQARSFPKFLADEVSDIPRQLGLTARYGIEGVGDALNFVNTPIRAGINLFRDKPIPPFAFSMVADDIGLPQPKNENERIIASASKMMAGGAIPMSLAKNAAQITSGTTQKVFQQMAAKPTAQAVSAGAAGAAGQTVKEGGGGNVAQFLASLAAGVAAPMAMGTGGRLMSMAQGARTVSPQTINVKIENAFKGTDVDFAQLPKDIQNSIRNDVQQALSTGGDVSPDALRRLADYKLVGATPTRAGVTLDPAIVTQQKNLAKLGVNSKDAAAQELAQVANKNNARLIERMNALGAAKGVENEAAGGMLSGNLADIAARSKAKISELYNAARDSSGRSAPLDPSHFTQKLGDDLSQANLEAFLPAEIRTMVNNFATGKTPLNVNTAEQFKTIVGNAQRASQDGNVRMALGLVRNSLDDTPLLGQMSRQGGNQVALQGQSSLGNEALDAFTKARAANRAFMETVEKTPALKATMDDASVKGFFDKHVLRGDSNELRNTLKVLRDNPSAVQGIRENVLSHLKQKATSGAADEVGAFSQSRFNAALKMLGANKLKLLFSPEEIAQLQAVGRVASYEQFQPVGSAVNNSNTAGAVGGMLERIGNSSLMSKIPLGKMLAEPIQNISIGINSKNALNVPNAISTPQFLTDQQKQTMMLNPMIFGLLGNQNQ